MNVWVFKRKRKLFWGFTHWWQGLVAGMIQIGVGLVVLGTMGIYRPWWDMSWAAWCLKSGLAARKRQLEIKNV